MHVFKRESNFHAAQLAKGVVTCECESLPNYKTSKLSFGNYQTLVHHFKLHSPQSQTDLFSSDLTPPIYHLHMLYTYNPIQPDLSYTFVANQGISQPSHT